MNFEKYLKTLEKITSRFGKGSKVFKDAYANYQRNVRGVTGNCLLCKKTKVHNNSFCSAKCCKEYNFAKKQIRYQARLDLKFKAFNAHRLSKCFDGGHGDNDF